MRAGWPPTRLGECCAIDKRQGNHQGLPYVGLEHIESNTARFVGSPEHAQVLSSTFRFTAQHVLYGRLRPYLNKVLLPTFEGHCSTEIFPLLPGPRLDRKYLKFWLMMDSTVKSIDSTCTGARMPRANMDAVMELALPVPPLPEQRRIVGILDRAFEGIATAKANAERNAENGRAVFASQLESEFRHRGAAWERLTLASLLERGWIEDHMDGNHGSDYPRKEEFVDAGVPYLSAQCLVNESIDMSRAKYLSPSRADRLRKGFARDNDVLFAHNATVGPVAILHTGEERVVLGTSLTYYRCNPARILPQYLAHYMRSFAFQVQYLQVMRQSTRNQVPITKQREFWHVIPPLQTQRLMVGVLDTLLSAGRELSGNYERKLNALEVLRGALLHQAFEGNL